MGEQSDLNKGDALSRLIQLQAGRHNIRLVWVGNGTSDLITLVTAYATQARMSKHLWSSMRELMMIPEMKELPEPLQAHITSTILKAQALTELETEECARRATMNKPTKGPA
jgi:hypothetical protein